MNAPSKSWSRVSPRPPARMRNQLIQNPELTAQLAQAPEVFQLMMNQGN